MEDLPTSNLQLVLGVKEGSNFDRIQKPTVIIATLNGHSRESKRIPPDCNPQYVTALMWETDKNALRKMRCHQTPVKIECYAVNDNGSREKLGYTILSIRSAQIVLQGKESNIRKNWHDILGIRNDFSSCRPKLLLYLVIKERRDGKAESSHPMGAGLHQITSSCANNMPVWLEEDHLIQLGPSDTCRDIFLFSIIAVAANNLPESALDYKMDSNSKISIVYHIFDCFFSLRPLQSELTDDLFINERIVVKIRTSISVLLDYLKTTPHFFIRVKINGTFVGQSEVNLVSLVETSYFQNMNSRRVFSLFTKQYYSILKDSESKEIVVNKKTDGSVRKTAGLQIHIKLQHVESKVEEDYQVSNNPQQRLEFLSKTEHSEKRACQNSEPCCSGISHFPSSKKLVQPIENNQLCSVNSSSNDRNCHIDNVSSRSFKTHRRFCLNVHLKAIKFFYSNPDLQKIEFRFYEPQGELITAAYSDVKVDAGQIISLKEIKCKLYFITTAQEIEETLSAFCPRINLCDAYSSETRCLAQVYLDIKRLFHDEEHHFEFEAPMIDCHDEKKIGCICTSINLSEYIAPVSKNEANNSNQNGISSNGRVDDLKCWEEIQKKTFLGELQKKEETHLSLLHQEWKRRRECLESKLTLSIQQCQLLADNLNTMTESLKKQKIQSLDKKTELLQTNREWQWKYDSKLQELQSKLQEMHREFTSQSTRLEQQNRNLVTQVNALLDKRIELQKIVSEQADEIKIFKKSSLNEDKPASVFLQSKRLEEKLEEAQKNESFFKEQWANTVRELNRLQLGIQQSLLNQSANNKKELDNIELEQILHVDSAALTHDQIALNQIQREIDSMNPGFAVQQLEFVQNKHLFASQLNSCFNSETANITS